MGTDCIEILLDENVSVERVEQLINTGYDVLLVTLPNGSQVVYKRPTLYKNRQKKGVFN